MKHVIIWFDVPTLDFDRAVKFYSEILNDQVRVDDFMGEKLGFFPMGGEREGVGGDIVQPREDYKPSKDGTRVYLNCENNLDEVISRVEPAGGKIIKPKFSLGENMGWVAIIEDTEGNYVGLHGM